MASFRRNTRLPLPTERLRRTYSRSRTTLTGIAARSRPSTLLRGVRRRAASANARWRLFSPSRKLAQRGGLKAYGPQWTRCGLESNRVPQAPTDLGPGYARFQRAPTREHLGTHASSVPQLANAWVPTFANLRMYAAIPACAFKRPARWKRAYPGTRGSKLVQTIQCSDLVGFRECRVVEDAVSEELDRAIQCHRSLADMNDLGSAFTYCVDTKQFQ